MKHERLEGANSCSPHYFRAFNGEHVSLNAIRQENQDLAYTWEIICRQRQHFGQMELPEPVGTGDIIYPPLKPNGKTTDSEIAMREGVPYELFQS